MARWTLASSRLGIYFRNGGRPRSCAFSQDRWHAPCFPPQEGNRVPGALAYFFKTHPEAHVLTLEQNPPTRQPEGYAQATSRGELVILDSGEDTGLVVSATQHDVEKVLKMADRASEEVLEMAEEHQKAVDEWGVLDVDQAELDEKAGYKAAEEGVEAETLAPVAEGEAEEYREVPGQQH